MRLIWTIPLLAMAACSNAGGDEPSLGKAIWERLKDVRSSESAEPQGKATPTRKQITDFNVAMVQMNLEGEDIFPILLPTHVNGPYVIYGNKFRQSLTLRESQITGTRGFGTDLVSASSSDNDPLKVLTPPKRWPATVEREYRFGGGGPNGRVERYTCTLTPAGENTITLAGTPIKVIGYAENCSGEAGQFTNLYAADTRTGRVWQSKQYVGPLMPAILLDVLEPLTE